MIYLYYPSAKWKEVRDDLVIESPALWYDLYDPTPDEIKTIETFLGIEIPNQAEMNEIEFSSRCYIEERASFMTVNIVVSADLDRAESHPVTFVLNGDYFLTLRYTEPKSILNFKKKLSQKPERFTSSQTLFFGVMESIVGRLADIAESIGEKVDKISSAIFDQQDRGKLKTYLMDLGNEGDLSAKARLSLEHLDRMFKFFLFQEQSDIIGLETLRKDVSSISEHLTFIFNKINFLLDATLGFINIEQNNIVKIFSIAAVIFLPPTLIASIYGMNFKIIPELSLPFGYPLALLLMVISAIFPYIYCKRKGWFR